MRQALKGSDKQAGNEKHEKTEGDLKGNKHMHQATPRAGVLAAFERTDRPDGRGAQRGREAKQQRYPEGQRQAESKHTPVRWKKQARWIVGWIDHANDERRGPPGEQTTDGGREEGEPGAFHKHELH